MRERERAVWLTPLVFPMIATSRQGIIDRSDIGSAGLTYVRRRVETVHIYFISFLQPNSFTLFADPSSAADWQPILNRFEEKKSVIGTYSSGCTALISYFIGMI